MKPFPNIACLGSCLLLSCGLGPSLKTLEASGNISQPNARMNIQLPRGAVTVIADGLAGGTEVRAKLDVYNRGASGITFSPASIDDIALSLNTTDTVSVSLGSEATKPNFTYALEVHVPSDYLFWSPGAQTSNSVITGEGEIRVKGLKGAETGHRDFTFEAGNPTDSYSHPEMTIEDVDGIIYASAWGPMTISGCRAISMATGAGSGDHVDLSLGTGAIAEKAYLSSCGSLTIRLDPASDFTFDNTIAHLGVVPIGTVKNLDPGSISGPETVDVNGASFERVTIGTGAGGLFDVYVTDKDISYRLK